jgi:predicted transcriptional regulator
LENWRSQIATTFCVIKGEKQELEIATGRKSSNLSRTLKTMSRYGIVDLVKHKKSIKPVVKATDFKVEFGIN